MPRLEEPKGSLDRRSHDRDPLVGMDPGEIPLHESLVHLDGVGPPDARRMDEHEVEEAAWFGSSLNLPNVEGVGSISHGPEVPFSRPTPVSGNNIRDGSGTGGEVEDVGHLPPPEVLQEADDELDNLDGSGLQVRPDPVGGLGTSLGVLAVDATPRQAWFIGDRRLPSFIEEATDEASTLHLVDNMPDETEGLFPAVGRERSGVGDSNLCRRDRDRGTGTGVVQPSPVGPPEQPHLDLADALHAVHRHVDRQDGGPDGRGQ